MDHDFNQNSRSGYRAKRKKTNIILNSLIVVVLLLIIFVAYNIFAPGNEKAAPKKATPKTEQKQSVKKDTKEENKAEEATTDGNSSDQATDEDQQSDETSTATSEDETQAMVTEGGSTPNVLKTIENPSWKPVGTTQTGDHTAVYDQSSVDWQEMLNAISYATNLAPDNMTVYWLGRDKETTNGSRGTVYSKTDNQQKFRVFIQWVDGEGWEPTKVEELAELEK